MLCCLFESQAELLRTGSRRSLSTIPSTLNKVRKGIQGELLDRTAYRVEVYLFMVINA
jgi:hypothetical protein